MKNIFSRSPEKQEQINVTQQLFEQYKAKKEGGTKEIFYEEIVSEVASNIDIDEDGPSGSLDSDYEVYAFHVDDLKIEQKGKNISGEITYSYREVDEDGNETGDEEGSSKKLSFIEMTALIRGIKEKIDALK